MHQSTPRFLRGSRYSPSPWLLHPLIDGPVLGHPVQNLLSLDQALLHEQVTQGIRLRVLGD